MVLKHFQGQDLSKWISMMRFWVEIRVIQEDWLVSFTYKTSKLRSRRIELTQEAK